MTITTTINQLAIQTLAELLKNVAWFILIWFGFKMVAKEIKEGVKHVPEWLDKYERMKKEQNAIDWARGGFEK